MYFYTCMFTGLHSMPSLSLSLSLPHQSLTHSSTDIRVVGCDVCASLESVPDPLLSSLLPLLLQNTKEKNTAVRTAAEKTITMLVHGDVHLKVKLMDFGFTRVQ